MATGKGSGRRAVGIGVNFQGTKDGGFGCVGSRLVRDPVEVHRGEARYRIWTDVRRRTGVVGKGE